MSSKNSTVIGPQSALVPLVRIASMSQTRSIGSARRMYDPSTKVAGLFIVRVVVGHGSTSVITNVADVDKFPTVPVISKVY